MMLTHCGKRKHMHGNDDSSRLTPEFCVPKGYTVCIELSYTRYYDKVDQETSFKVLICRCLERGKSVFIDMHKWAKQW